MTFSMDNLFDVHLRRCRGNVTFTWCLSEENTDQEVGLKPAKVVKVTDWRRGQFRKCRWRKEGFEIKDWINHFQDITRISDIADMQFLNIHDNFDEDSVTRLLKMYKIEYLLICAGGSAENCHAIFQKVHTDRICLCVKVLPKVVLEKVLIQNRNRVDVSYHFPIKLNDILMMNCEEFNVTDPSGFSMKAFNRFLKIWRTGFNRCLRRFEISFHYERFPQDCQIEILKGIDYIEVTPGRFDFRGAKGSRATLMIEPRPRKITLLISD
ncbi:unnamed protein product [Caenorhabditis brenneri]